MNEDSQPVTKYFACGEECEVLGVKMIHDPERGKREFPSHPETRTPQIFVLDAGPLADVLGIGDIRPGDAFWTIGGNSRYKRFHIDSIPSFVNAVVVMHNPYGPTQFCWVDGSDRNDLVKRGWTCCALIHVPRAQIRALRDLRRRLREYARTAGLDWRMPRMFFTGGPYERHVRNAPARLSQSGAVEDFPVHEQYLLILVHEVGQRAPCTARLIQKRRRIEVVQDDGVQVRDRPLTRVMAQYQVGSPEYLFRQLDEIASPFVFGGVRAQFKRKGPTDLTISVERVPETECTTSPSTATE